MNTDHRSLFPDVKISFGLRAQGHLEYVRQAVRAGVSWQEIGREIGWDGDTARRYFEMESEGHE